MVNLYLFTYVTGCLEWVAQSGWADGDAESPNTPEHTEADSFILIQVLVFGVRPLYMVRALAAFPLILRQPCSVENQCNLTPPPALNALGTVQNKLPAVMIKQ